jgi:glycosyltransferase involved in cell wall biosynthesis
MHRPLRICQFLTDLAPAGVERCVYELATRLDRNRFDVHVAGLRDGTMADDLRRAGVDTTVLDVRHKLDVDRFRSAVDFLRAGRFDILHTHLFHADVLGLLASLSAGRLPVVHTVHLAERRFRPWRFCWYRLSRRHHQGFIAVTDEARRVHHLRTGVAMDRIEVIHNGVDVHRIAPDPVARRQLRQQWGVDETHCVMGFVAPLDKQEGLDVLLETMRWLNERKPTPRLVIAGVGPMREELLQFIHRDPAGRLVRYVGPAREVPTLLAAMDMLVLPTRQEGFGLIAAEAMAASLPVVASKVTGPAELVEHDRTGLLIRPESPWALARAIRRLVDDPARRVALGQAGRKRIATHFIMQQYIRQHETYYQALADRLGLHRTNPTYRSIP